MSSQPRAQDRWMTLCDQAGRLIEINRPTDAIPMLLKAAGLEPKQARPHNFLAWAYIGLKDWDAALLATHRASALEPDDEWSYRLRSIVYLAQGNKQKALKAAQESVRLAPESALTLCCLFDVEFARGERKHARLLAERVRTLAPESSIAHYLIGMTAVQASQWLQAERHFRDALHQDPNNAEALNRLGEALLKQGKSLDAIAHLKDSMRINPHSWMGRWNLYLAHDYAAKQALPKWLLLPLLFFGIAVPPAKSHPSNVVLQILPWLFLSLTFGGIAYFSWRHHQAHPELNRYIRQEQHRAGRAFLRHPVVRSFYLAITLFMLFGELGHLIPEPAFSRYHFQALLWLCGCLIIVVYGIRFIKRDQILVR